MDVYAKVTERIIEEMEKGVIPWKKPWVGGRGAISHVTGKSYSFLNQLLLGKPGEWLTFNQIKKEHGTVKKGEKSRFVVFWKWLKRETDKKDDDGNIIIEQIPYLQYFNVFHIDQCDGIEPKHVKDVSDFDANEAAQSIFDDYTAREGIRVNLDGDASFYSPSDDSITLPRMKRFKKLAEYYSTAFHEAVHSTGVKNRLARDGVTGNIFFGSEDYSKEELIAELGASMLVSHVGLETESSFDNNVAYIAGWLKALENDKRMIVTAAGRAEKAVKYILGSKDDEIPA